MESGKFVALVVIVIALVGATGYFTYAQTQTLNARLDQLQVATTNAAAAASQAQATANQVKASVDTTLASVSKAGDIAQLAKQASDAAAAAAKSASDAEAAAASKTAHGSSRKH